MKLNPSRTNATTPIVDPVSFRVTNDTFTENANNHDFGANKVMLRGAVQTVRTSSVTNAYADLDTAADSVLNNIYAHPNMGPFVAKQLIQQLVTSNPSPAYVARVADVFNRNKAAANQLFLVARAILLDPEARGDDKSSNVTYGKLREPVLFLTNLMREFNVRSDPAQTTSPTSDGNLNNFTSAWGQDLFRPPSVFSYFSPSKVVTTFGTPPMPVLGPEFQIETTTTALARVNFLNTMVAPDSTRTVDVVRARDGTAFGTNPLTGQPNVVAVPYGTAVDVSSLTSLAVGDGSALVNRLNMTMMHNAMPAAMRTQVLNAVQSVTLSPTPTQAQLLKRVRTAIQLIGTSSNYQVQQ
jgi:hypothetical protein